MTLLWVTSNLILSRLIRWCTGDDCSHFAVLFDDHDLVLHATAKGVVVEWAPLFFKRYDSIHELWVKNLPEKQSLQLYREMINGNLKTPYDYGALLFFPIILLARMIGFKYKRNLWGSKKANMCVEIARGIKMAGVIDAPWPRNLEMTTPHGLYEALRKSKDVEEAI